MDNRDRAKQLLASKSRQLRTTETDCILKLSELRRFFDQADITHEIMDAFAPIRAPIRVVTLIEVFARKWLATIIDHGYPYQEHAASLFQKKKIRIDFFLAQALQGRKISLGELLSNSLAYSSFSNVIKNFTDVLGESFSNLIHKECQRCPEYEYKLLGKSIRKEYSEISAELEVIYEARHILTHELPTKHPIQNAQIISGIDSAIAFVVSAGRVFTELLYPNPGTTQLDMNLKAENALKESRGKLAVLLQKVKSLTNKSLLYKSQVAWKKYRHLQAVLRSNYGEPNCGSIAPWIYYLESNQLTCDRIEQLNWWLEKVEGEF